MSSNYNAARDWDLDKPCPCFYLVGFIIQVVKCSYYLAGPIVPSYFMDKAQIFRAQ